MHDKEDTPWQQYFPNHVVCFNHAAWSFVVAVDRELEMRIDSGGGIPTDRESQLYYPMRKVEGI